MGVCVCVCVCVRGTEARWKLANALLCVLLAPANPPAYGSVPVTASYITAGHLAACKWTNRIRKCRAAAAREHLYSRRLQSARVRTTSEPQLQCWPPPGLYLSNFIRGGSKFWLLKSTTVLMHRYIESRPPPLAFFNSSRGSEIFAGRGFNPV